MICRYVECKYYLTCGGGKPHDYHFACESGAMCNNGKKFTCIEYVVYKPPSFTDELNKILDID